MNQLQQLIQWLKQYASGSAGGNLGPDPGTGPMNSAGQVTNAPSQPMTEQNIAPGATTATGPVTQLGNQYGLSPAAAASGGGGSLEDYANVMKALGGMDQSNNNNSAPRPVGNGRAYHPAAPGQSPFPMGQFQSPSAVGQYMASPSGQQIIQILKQLQQQAGIS